MKAKRPQLGLLAEHDEQWVAGSLYVQAVLHAVAAVPESSRPDIKLLLKREVNPDDFQWAAGLIDSILPYDRRRPRSLGGRFRHVRRHVMRNGRLPQWLGSRVCKADVDVLFPCLQSPGADCAVKWIGWIPDFQHLHLPELFSEELIHTRDLICRELVQEASHVVVSSGQAREDLMRHYGADSGCVSVYRFRTMAQSEWFAGDPKAVARFHDLPERFVMFPSQYWRHKEHLTLIEALAGAVNDGLDDIYLVLTGHQDDFRHPDHARAIQQRIHELGIGNRVRQLGLLPREEQIQLMRRACAVIQPSRFEGWSMLVEDCRALGQNLILSDIPVHREQAYDRARLFEVGNAASLKEVMMKHWPSLQPGPDLEAEAEAREENARLVLENGRFLAELFSSIAKP